MVSAHPSSNESQLQRLAKYRADGANIIYLCDPDHLPEIHRLVVTEIKLDQKPEAGDIYEPSGAKGKFAIHLSALERLWVAANGQWNFDETKPLLVTPDLYQYQAVGFFTAEYGKSCAYRGDASFDMLALRDDLQYKYDQDAKKYKKDQSWIDYCVNRDFRAKRSNALKLVASDAKAVVIRKLLGLQGPFAVEVFSKPFVLVRCVIAPDLNDPECLKMIRNASVAAALGLYGPSAGHQPAALPAPLPTDFTAPEPRTELYQPVDMPEPDPAPTDDEPFDITPPAPEPEPEPIDGMRIDFQNTPKNERMVCLSAMAEGKGLKITVGSVSSILGRKVKSGEMLTDADELKIYDYLAALPNKVTP